MISICFAYPQPIQLRYATQTREYPTTGQAAAASGAANSTLIRDRCLGGWVDDHRVAEVLELGDQPSGVGFVIASAVPVGA